ncbi:MAG TPA: hypothetical protein VE868_13145, partial [Balneolaceae bacterium]|nr:hypothetical protein [Balneolaceae bacterium]
SQSQNLGDKLYGALDNLMIIQRIYYMAGQDNKAKAVANRVNNITGKRIQFPSNKKQSKKALQNRMH